MKTCFEIDFEPFRPLKNRIILSHLAMSSCPGLCIIYVNSRDAVGLIWCGLPPRAPYLDRRLSRDAVGPGLCIIYVNFSCLVWRSHVTLWALFGAASCPARRLVSPFCTTRPLARLPVHGPVLPSVCMCVCVRLANCPGFAWTIPDF